MSNIKYPYSRPNINSSDVEAVIRVLHSQFLTQGPVVKSFEQEIEKKFSVKSAIICNSGTAALHSVYKSLGLNKDNGLITTPITFLATANAARMCNAPVYFADVDPHTGLLTSETLEKAFERVNFKVKVVTVVHLGGHICDLESISKIVKKKKCFLVEDACHAIGAKYYSNKKKGFYIGACKYSIASTFSFHAIKNITMGEGGCVTTNNKKLANDIRLNISHGMIKDSKKMLNAPRNSPWYYEMNDIGWNYRASEIACALGLNQFKRLDKIISKRTKIADYYKMFLEDNVNIKLPKYYTNADNSGWHLYQLSIDFKSIEKSKGDFINYLKKSSIGSQVHYIPLNYQPYYKKFSNIKNLKGAIQFYNNTISIPMHTNLKKSCISYISKVINDYFK
jgi:dTDP-4-amino-4,6-dideoxygalactose transaminase